MNEVEHRLADEIVARWARATDRPTPMFRAPGERRRSVSLSLAALVATVLVVGTVAAVTFQPRLADKNGGRTAEQALDSLREIAGARFRLHLEWAYPGAVTQTLEADGAIDPKSGEVMATGRGTGSDPSMPMFGGPESGAIVLTDGRLFVKDGTDAWHEVPLEPADPRVASLQGLVDFDRVASAARKAIEQSARLGASAVACGQAACTRHEFELAPSVMTELCEEIVRVDCYEPPMDMGPTKAAILVDDAGRVAGIEGSFVAGDTTISLRLDLVPLLEFAPVIETPQD